MANPLKLEIVMSMVDKVLAPLRGVDKQSKQAAESLRETRRTLKALDDQQAKVTGLMKQQEAYAKASNELKINKALLDGAVKAGTASAAEIAKRERAIVKQTAALRDQQQKMIQMRSAAAAAGVGVGSLAGHQARLQAEAAKTTANLKTQTDALRRLGDQQRKTAAIREQHGRNMAMAAGVGGAGAAGMVTGRAIAQPVIRSLGAFSDQENSATQLQASMMQADGSVPEEFQRITDLAMRLGDRLPGTTAEFQEMMTMLRRQGLSAQTILGGTGEAAALLGVQLRMPVTEVAEFSAKMQDATQTTEKDMLGLMDMIQRTFYLGVDSGNMLQGFTKMSPILSVLKKKGLDAANTLAPLLVMMDQSGMKGESAGNAIRKVFDAGLDAKKMGKANDALKGAKAGFELSLTDKKGNFAGMDNLFQQLEKLKSIESDTVRKTVIKELFGDDAETLQVLNTLMDKGRAGYDEVLSKMKAQADLQQRVNVQLGTLSNVVEAAQGTFTNVMASVGATVAGDAKGIVDWLGEISAGIGAWVQENPALTAGITRVVAVLAALYAGLGAVMLALAGLAAPLLIMRLGFGMLGVRLPGIITLVRMLAMGFVRLGIALLTTPIGWFVLAVAALAAVVFAVYKNWGPIKAFFLDIWNSLSTGVAALPGIFVAWFAQVFAFMATLPTKFGQFGVDMMQGLINGITGALGGVRDAITGAASSAITWFKDTLGIRSPSRVFMAAGVNVGEGAAQGIQSTQGMLRNAALGMAAASAVALPAMAAAGIEAPGPGLRPARIDNRPAMSAAAPRAPITVQGDTINLHIHAGPGMDEMAIGRIVADKLQQLERAKAARVNSMFIDSNN
ncbi:TP901 family phage tail tape measure protein [Comamonas sp. BIGb0124]|uniref:phage tail tape measure protein n=1 Tax=Comamonas sp. BIGb0124 TaxID=2485130 RepID=UPI000F47E64C|nr:phage tail tape measure protein [Comamonas sp. BIGb0124]ROR23033.1 TP901 family phage tail tape measure protein [Comamonas sp. BIGb0124]